MLLLFNYSFIGFLLQQNAYDLRLYNIEEPKE